MAHSLSRAALSQFTGTANWYRHPMNPRLLYTDGARYVAEAGGAYWLLDEIALAQRHVPAVAGENFQVWRLGVRADRTALLECSDGNGDNGALYVKAVPFTDFPLVSLELYVANGTILLPSEY